MVDTPPAVLAAVMVVCPGAWVVMTPLSSMVATLSSAEVHVMVLSAASSGRTVACSVQVMPLFRMPPSCSSVTLVGTTTAGAGSSVGAGVAVVSGAAVSGVASSLREVSADRGISCTALLPHPARLNTATSAAAAVRIRVLFTVIFFMLFLLCVWVLFSYTKAIGSAGGEVKGQPKLFDK